MSRNPFIAIMRASARGEGITLTADEVEALTFWPELKDRAAREVSFRTVTDAGGWAEMDPGE